MWASYLSNEMPSQLSHKIYTGLLFNNLLFPKHVFQLPEADLLQRIYLKYSVTELIMQASYLSMIDLQL